MKLDVAMLRRLMEERELSQSALAARANISRVTLNTLLKKLEPEVHAKTEARIAQALGCPPGALDRRRVENQYAAAVLAMHRHHDLTGLGVPPADTLIPLDQAYASPLLRERQGWESCEPGETALEEKRLRPVRRRSPCSLGAAMSRHARFFLLGEPGAGKTTTLRHLSAAYSAGTHAQHGYPADATIPVFVRAADWAEQLRDGQRASLIEAALHSLQLADPASTLAWLLGALDQGRVLLLIDGLDEVADPNLRTQVIEGLRSFLDDRPGVHLIATSRIVGFEAPRLSKPLAICTLEPLTAEAVTRFCTAWCGVRHGHAAERECGVCNGRVQGLRRSLEHPRIRFLARNPMTLTILLRLHDAGSALPQRRWDLYEKLSEVFLFSWQEKKRAAISGAPDSATSIDDRELIWLLEALAIEMQTHDRTLAPRWWMAGQLREFLQREFAMPGGRADAESDALLWSLQERSGLVVERGPDRYGFWHLAFQEYFAARAVLASDDPLASLRPYLHHPRWREVVRLVGSQLDRRRTPQLLRMLLDDPDPTGRFLQRGLLAALGCLADGAAVHDSALISDLMRTVIELGGHRWLGIAMEAMQSLAELLDTRMEAEVRTAVKHMLGRAQDSLDPQDYQQLLEQAVEIGLFTASDDPPGISLGHDASVPLGSQLRGTHIEGSGNVDGISPIRAPSRYESAWAAATLARMKTDPTPQARASCASELGRFASRRADLRKQMIAALVEERDSSVRHEIILALGGLAFEVDERDRLLWILDHDEDARVRGASAAALLRLSISDGQLRDRLLKVAVSREPAAVRRGAVRGLSLCASRYEAVASVLRKMLADPSESDYVRIAAIYSLQEVLHATKEGTSVLLGLVEAENGELLPGVAAFLLAQYLSGGRIDWDGVPVEAVERALGSIPYPCCHMLDALRSLLDAREYRKLVEPREVRLKRHLASHLPRIRTAFMFGSAARGEQGIDSDIDLMVIGELTLKELAPSLRQAEQELGRQVNAVLYSEAEWDTKVNERSRFVTQILKGKKVPIIGELDELAAMGG